MVRVTLNRHFFPGAGPARRNPKPSSGHNSAVTANGRPRLRKLLHDASERWFFCAGVRQVYRAYCTDARLAYGFDKSFLEGQNAAEQLFSPA